MRAVRISGARRVFRHDGLTVAAATEAVSFDELVDVLSRLSEHGRQLGVAQVNRFLTLPVGVALAAMDNDLSMEYAVELL